MIAIHGEAQIVWNSERVNNNLRIQQSQKWTFLSQIQCIEF